MQEAVDALVNGEDGERVIAQLTRRYRTPGSLNTTMSQVRKHIYDNNMRAAEYDTTELEESVQDELVWLGVSAFVDATLREQMRVKKEHEEAPTWPDNVESALQRVQLLPQGMETFVLSKEVHDYLKRKHEASIVTKNESILYVKIDILDACTAILRRATVKSSYPTLAIPLLLLSGRRTTEIMNGKSTFAPVPDDLRICKFSGQLKIRGNTERYTNTIPLLCDWSTFARGLSLLRLKQKGEKIEDSKKCHTRFQANLKAGMAQVLPCLAGRTPHDLRSVYLTLCDHMFRTGVTKQRLAMQILGHVTIQESLSYNHVHVEETDRRFCFGDLAL